MEKHGCDVKAAAGNRTQDLVLTKDALYQLSYSSRSRIADFRMQISD
jgi:hypothetical protein